MTCMLSFALYCANSKCPERERPSLGTLNEGGILPPGTDVVVSKVVEMQNNSEFFGENFIN